MWLFPHPVCSGLELSISETFLRRDIASSECGHESAVPPWVSRQGPGGSLRPRCLFSAPPVFLESQFLPFSLFCIKSSLPSRNLVSPHCPIVLAPASFPCGALFPLLQTAVLLFLWPVPFLPQPWLSLGLSIPDFHESGLFLPTCPFSLGENQII